MTFDDKNLEDLPAELVAQLRAADESPALIAAKVDRSIARLASEHFELRSVTVQKRSPVWFAIAASVLLAVLILPVARQVDDGVLVLYQDVDRSGQIDIADVLALARDGRRSISAAELDEFAMQVVSLHEEVDAS